MNQASLQIDRDKIPVPEVQLTDLALGQLKMMWEFDPTLENQVFRFSIDGKGCDGFDYACGFSEKNEADFLVSIEQIPGLYFAFDPFAARYMPFVHLDFQQELTTNREGFVITNMAQAEFKGKFWRKDPSKAVPVKE